MTHRDHVDTDDLANHFGNHQVDASEKAGLVRQVFDSVAPRYDLMNDLMSSGVHRLWKAAMVDWLCPHPDMRLLDMAGGTGDIAFRVADRLSNKQTDNAHPVTICDINFEMLEVGQARAARRHLKDDALRWVCANAENLPLEDQTFSAYTIAFGIRNVTDIPKALSEAHRILEPGGRFLCLEFSKPQLPGLGQLYNRYSETLLPWLGQKVTGDADAYRYLVESIQRFPDQSGFKALIAAAGFESIKVRSLSGGIAALHSAWRL